MRLWLWVALQCLSWVSKGLLCPRSVSYTGDNSIRSATSGTVHAKSSTGDLGNRIVINEGSVKVQYAHMASQSTLSIGATVQQGDTLGTIGATGNTGGFAHLHFSVFSSGATCNSGNACWGVLLSNRNQCPGPTALVKIKLILQIMEVLQHHQHHQHHHHVVLPVRCGYVRHLRQLSKLSESGLWRFLDYWPRYCCHSS